MGASWFLRGVFVFGDKGISVEGEFAPPLTVYVGPNGSGKSLFLAALSMMGSTVSEERRLGIISASSLVGSYTAFAGKLASEGTNAYILIFLRDARWERYRDLVYDNFSEMRMFDEIVNEQMGKTPLNHYKVINVVKEKGLKINKIFSYHPNDVKEYKENYRPLSDGEAARTILETLLDASNENDLLILDSPETFLDPLTMRHIIHNIVAKVEEGVLFAIATHSLEFITTLAMEMKNLKGFVIRFEDLRAVKRWRIQSVLEEGKDVRLEKTFN